MLPQLRKLEERHPEVVRVVGVHSGKFPAERVTEHIREASLRLGVHHPIVNDRQFRIWRSYAVRAWPTLVVVDPRGYVLGSHAGEFTAEMLEQVVDRALSAFESAGQLQPSPDDPHVEEPAIAPGTLRYPGKVAVADGRIAIADSGRDRVLVGELTSDGLAVESTRVFGGQGGFEDGSRPRFARPQGLAFDGETLYVADAENHALRAIALGTGETRTIAGTGTQLRTRADLAAGALSSPWDVTAADGRVYVAMAGTHQIWSTDGQGRGLRVHCGSGAEALEDGPGANAALAQPMGIVAADGRLWFADAESSAIRWSDADENGRVETIVGTGLFDFGDRDGAGDAVLLQHAQGVVAVGDGRLLIADSYNGALKWVDPRTREVTTWLRGFHEPSGLAVTPSRVYVADTNAHRIVVVDRADGSMRPLEIRL